LAILLSAVTWIPTLLLFSLQSGLASGWLWSHLWMIIPIIFCSAISILTLSLVALAISAWVKIRIVASGVTFIAFIIPAAIGEIYKRVMGPSWGRLLNFTELFRHILTHSFRAESDLPALSHVGDVPVPLAWLMLILVCIFALFLINSRLRAR